MCIVRIVVVVVALLLPVASATLAYVDPADPTWVGGYWDDDDFDYAVDAILHSWAVAPASAVGEAGPWWIPVAQVVLLEVNAVPPLVSTTDSPRGPPPPSSSHND